MTKDNLVERQNEWVEEHYPSTDQILVNEEGLEYVNWESETGIEKVYLPDELQTLNNN